LLRIDELGPTPPQELAARLELSEADLYPHLQILCEKELITGSDEHAPLAVRPEARGVLEKLVEARREDLEGGISKAGRPKSTRNSRVYSNA